MISVIIPTYREPEHLDLCLRSAFEGQSNENQIIVVVDGYYELNKPILNKYPNVSVLNFVDNQGLSIATNWGVYNARHPWVLVVNDDNVFPREWDSKLLKDAKQGVVLSPNQIEPNPSMFRQFHIKNLGNSPESFDLLNFWEYETNLQKKPIEPTGCTLPFLMYKHDFLAVGGWDELFPSPHVVDWDFFLRCEYLGFLMNRTYDAQFYHFSGAATRKTFEENIEFSKKEQLAHEFFLLKWGKYANHNPINNSKKWDDI
jgi:glycosyltransferase involved in cell wall biosynthesis